MKMKKELDLISFINKKVNEYETKLANKAMRVLYPQGFVFDKTKLTQCYESVKEYAINVWTVRYDGKLLFRRYMSDSSVFIYEYESPVFGDKTN